MISVIMPAYNAEKYIAEAIESIMNQTLRDFELIIIDDSSTDNTYAISCEYARQDARIKVIQCMERSCAGARNRGIEQATSSYIALMDADDIALPSRLELQYSHALKNPDVVVWGSYLQEMTEDGILMDIHDRGATTVDEFNALNREQDLISLYAGVSLFKRDVFDAVDGFETRMPMLEDSELWDRMAQYGPILVIPQVTLYYRQHNKSASVINLKNEVKCKEFIIQRHRLFLQNKTLDFDDFFAQYDNLKPFARFSYSMRGKSQLFGRQAKIAKARKQYARTIMLYTLAVLCHPARFLSRLLKRLL